MRLVVSYTHGDGYTYSCDGNVPFIYESAEALLVDLEKAVSDYQSGFTYYDQIWNEHNKKWESFMERIRQKRKVTDEERAEWQAARHETILAANNARERAEVLGDPDGMHLYLNHFIENGKFYPPNIYTVDEWFASIP